MLAALIQLKEVRRSLSLGGAGAISARFSGHTGASARGHRRGLVGLEDRVVQRSLFCQSIDRLIGEVLKA